VVEEFAAFPNAEHDDLVDSSTQALLRFRQGGFISIYTDEQEERLPRRKVAYY
jgi:phage terminase large subunit-like protein